MFDELYNQVKAWIKDILLGKNITVSQNITKKLELGKDLIDKLKQSFNSELNSLLNVLMVDTLLHRLVEILLLILMSYQLERTSMQQIQH